MKYLCEIAALCSLAAAMPFPDPESSALSRRSHALSPYTASLKRKLHHDPHPRLFNRQNTIKSQPVIDDDQVRFLVPVTWGDQTLDAEFDTGSTDLWLAESGFTCYSTWTSGGSFQTPVDSSTCNFQNTYTPDSDFSPYEGVSFLDCYGSGDDGRCIAGQYGSVDVTIAGLTIPGQSVGSGSTISYKANGDGAQSGIVGASLASTPGTSSSGSYPSLFENLFVNYQFTPALEPGFSLSISRDASGNGAGGTLVIGGIPSLSDPTINATDSYVTAPFDLANPAGGEYTWYGIQLDALATTSTNADAGAQILIDSGNMMLELPEDFANSYNAMWGVNSDGSVDCGAVPADLWIGVGGQYLQINPVDLITTNSDGSCSSLVTPVAAGGIYWLGDPFLKNVIAVFDWGRQQMDFYSRPFYES